MNEESDCLKVKIALWYPIAYFSYKNFKTETMISVFGQKLRNRTVEIPKKIFKRIYTYQDLYSIIGRGSVHM